MAAGQWVHEQLPASCRVPGQPTATASPGHGILAGLHEVSQARCRLPCSHMITRVVTCQQESSCLPAFMLGGGAAHLGGRDCGRCRRGAPPGWRRSWNALLGPRRHVCVGLTPTFGSALPPPFFPACRPCFSRSARSSWAARGLGGRQQPCLRPWRCRRRSRCRRRRPASRWRRRQCRRQRKTCTLG